MRTGKLFELALIPDMPSQPVLRQMIRDRPDFPVIEHGRKGASYLLDLDAAAAFVRANWRDSRSEFSGVARASRANRPQEPSNPQLRLQFEE